MHDLYYMMRITEWDHDFLRYFVILDIFKDGENYLQQLLYISIYICVTRSGYPPPPQGHNYTLFLMNDTYVYLFIA